MPKTLYLCGISHETADASAVGCCAVKKEERPDCEARFMRRMGASEAVLLSTCNRVEYYFTADSADFDALKNEFFVGQQRFCYVEKNGSAAAHLFEVASGLRSQMTGETEIFGQVKDAYARAFESGHCGAVLNALFQKAAQVGKWVRTNTGIGHGKISIGSVSAELAAQIFDGIGRAKILLVGSGEAGRLIADALFVRGAKNTTIVSARRANADLLAAQIGVQSDDASAAFARLGEFDIVVCASSAGKIITADMLRAALEKRQSPMFVIDLSVPKNVDERCADLDDVFLYDMKDLSEIAAANMNLRRGEILKARAVIEKKASALIEKLGL